MDIRTFLYRQHGNWYFSFDMPRWVVDEIESLLLDGGQIRLASSGIIAGSGPRQEASLLFIIDSAADIAKRAAAPGEERANDAD